MYHCTCKIFVLNSSPGEKESPSNKYSISCIYLQTLAFINKAQKQHFCSLIQLLVSQEAPASKGEHLRKI